MKLAPPICCRRPHHGTRGVGEVDRGTRQHGAGLIKDDAGDRHARPDGLGERAARRQGQQEQDAGEDQ